MMVSVEERHRTVMASWRGHVSEEVMTQDVGELMLAIFTEMCQLIGQYFLADGGPSGASGYAIEDFRDRLGKLPA